MVELTPKPKNEAAAKHGRSQASKRSAAVMDVSGGGRKPQAGASPSNTAPANYTGVQILRSGVDSLYVSYLGELPAKHENHLENLKSLAQSEDPMEQAKATWLLADHPFAIRGRGKGKFPFLLADNWYHLQVSRSSAQKLPLVYAQIASELLTRSGVRASVRTLTNVVSVLAGKVIHPQISRVDLCVDFTTNLDLGGIPTADWITRAVLQTQHFSKGQFSGYTFGLGGPLSCRLYDKTLEIEKSKKEYLKLLWAAQGWDEVSPVWRLEFQYRGPILREASVRSLEELENKMNGLWSYASCKWLQLKQSLEGDTNRTRWPLYPEWEALQQASFGDYPTEPILRVYKRMVPSDDSLFINGLGGLTSFMAREGILSVDEAMPRYIDAARTFHRQRSRETDKTLTTYVREKVEQKRTRFAARGLSEYGTDGQRKEV